MQKNKRRIAFVLSLALLLSSLLFALFVVPGQVQAASKGCEYNPKKIDGQTYYQCMVIGTGNCLNERSVSAFATIEACVPDDTVLFVARQEKLTNHPIHGSVIWDILQGGELMVSDYYINTSHYNAFSPPIPSSTTPTATPTNTPTTTPSGTPSATVTPGSYDSVNGRLFADNSPWNGPIGSTVTLDPNSSKMVNMLAGGIHVAAMYQYGMPIYSSTASDPLYTVKDTGNDSLFEADQPIHIPAAAAPSPGTDHWMFIYDSTKKLLFEMWNTSKSGGTWTTQTGNVYSPTGDGVLQTDGSPQAGNGASYFGGVITDADTARGSINHALSLASQFTASSSEYPMVASDGNTPGGIPMGARLQLNPAVDCNALPGASVGEKMVCRALQVYGGYMRDTGGVPLSAYFEGENLSDPNRNPPTNPGDLGISGGVFGKLGLSDGMDLSAIPWGQLRILKSWNSFAALGSSTSSAPLASVQVPASRGLLAPVVLSTFLPPAGLGDTTRSLRWPVSSSRTTERSAFHPPALKHLQC